MRTLTIILLCGIMATAVNAAGFGKRSDEGSKVNARTSAPAPAVAARTSTPPQAARAFSTPSRPATVGYAPPVVSTPSPTPVSQAPINSGFRRGSDSVSRGSVPSAPAVVYRPSPTPVSQGPINSGFRRGSDSVSRSNAPSTPAVVSRPSPTPVAQTPSNTRSRGSFYSPSRDNSPSAPPVVSTPSAPVARTPSNTGGRGGFYSPSRNNTPSAPSVVSRPSAPVAQTPGNTGDRRGNYSVYRGNTPSAPAVTPRPSLTPSARNPGNIGDRRGAPSGSTGYYPNSGSRTTDSSQRSGRLPGTGNRTPRNVGDSSATAGHGSGYRPGTTSRLPGGTPGNNTHSFNRPFDPQRSSRIFSTGYTPGRTNYAVGYHPTRLSIPRGYVPPTYRQGFYHYPATYHPRPCFYGYWAPDYSPGFSYRSVYFSFGLFPYLQVTRISECSYTSISYVSEPLYIDGTYYNNSRYDRLDETLADIRSGWISGRYDLISPHVRAGQTIAVLLDGRYDYSISSDDYLTMTRDAIADLNTVSFVWGTVREGRNGTVTAFGEHSYQSSDQTRSVYVSYTLQKSGSHYYITEVGSSDNPLD